MPDGMVVVVGAGPCGLAAAREMHVGATVPFLVGTHEQAWAA